MPTSCLASCQNPGKFQSMPSFNTSRRRQNGSWWRHQLETYSTLLAICAGILAVAGEFPSQRPVAWSFDVFFDLRLNKRLSKPSRWWWFETPSYPLWRYCNVTVFRRLFKFDFLYQSCYIFIHNSLNFVSLGSINNTPALIEVIAWREEVKSYYPKSYFMTRVCVTCPRWIYILY